MSASKYIKEHGLPNVKYVAEQAGINRQLLHDWYNERFALFEVVVAGVWLQWADENKEPDPNITKEMIETDREYLKRARWNQ